MRVRFEWDDKKSASNLRKHGIGFDTAELVFDDPWQVLILDHDVDGEERWQTIGRAEDVLLLLVVHTVEDEEGRGHPHHFGTKSDATREENL